MAPKQPRHVYSEEDMVDAILDITDNGLSQHHAYQKYGIPQRSISNRFNGQTALADQIQPKQHLTRNQEAKLVS
jgi:hypothetical protein